MLLYVFIDISGKYIALILSYGGVCTDKIGAKHSLSTIGVDVNLGKIVLTVLCFDLFLDLLLDLLHSYTRPSRRVLGRVWQYIVSSPTSQYCNVQYPYCKHCNILDIEKSIPNLESELVCTVFRIA